MNGCNIYQRKKNWTEVSAEKLIVNEIPEKPWIYSMVDFITKLPLVARKNTILVVCDRLSKMAYFMTTMGRTLAEELV